MEVQADKPMPAILTACNEAMDKQQETKEKKSIKNLYRRFIKIRGNPREIAYGFSLGIFIGMSPTMGVQIILAVFIASLLKWNKISATIGVLITNAFTAPLLYTMTYLVGARILGMKNNFSFPKEMNLDSVMALMEKAPSILGAMTVGGVVVGIPLAIVSYFAAYKLSEFYQNKVKDKIPKVRSRSHKQKGH